MAWRMTKRIRAAIVMTQANRHPLSYRRRLTRLAPNHRRRNLNKRLRLHSLCRVERSTQPAVSILPSDGTHCPRKAHIPPMPPRRGEDSMLAAPRGSIGLSSRSFPPPRRCTARPYEHTLWRSLSPTLETRKRTLRRRRDRCRRCKLAFSNDVAAAAQTMLTRPVAYSHPHYSSSSSSQRAVTMVLLQSTMSSART